MLKFLRKSFLCDGQGADRRAILSSDRSCFPRSQVLDVLKFVFSATMVTCHGNCFLCYYGNMSWKLLLR